MVKINSRCRGWAPLNLVCKYSSFLSATTTPCLYPFERSCPHIEISYRLSSSLIISLNIFTRLRAVTLVPIAPSLFSEPLLEIRQLNTKQFSCNYMIIILIIYFWIAGQSVSNWGAWGKCSKDCDGEQTRTRECIASTPCGTLEDKRECSTNWCFSKYHLHKLTAVAGGISRASTLFFVLFCFFCFFFKESREAPRRLSLLRGLTPSPQGSAVERKHLRVKVRRLHSSSSTFRTKVHHEQSLQSIDRGFGREANRLSTAPIKRNLEQTNLVIEKNVGSSFEQIDWEALVHWAIRSYWSVIKNRGTRKNMYFLATFN